MTVTVIVTVFNRPAMLAACLRALALGIRRPDDVVVSDDGSDPGCARALQAMAAELPFPVRFVRQEKRGYRLAAARNNAVRHAAGDYLVSLDCDILLMPDALLAHARAARPGCFLAANRAFVSEADTATALHQALHPRLLDVLWDRADRSHLPRALRQFRRNLWLRRVGLAPRHKPKLLGCHFSMHRETFERVNGFDEAFEGWGLEDDDFALRLHKAGARPRSLIRDARALHLWHAPVASHPGATGASPNRAYFLRRDVPAFCVRGLRPPA